jgi:hypothetical protein|tara:strand:+ start:560 stop:988 length:429 start_codon:yes stop_codon:yes gene_type:complete
MAWRSKSKLRSNAIKHGYRSGFEHKVSDQLKENKVKFEYETTVIGYIKPETKHTYTIDFTLPNGILVETKGRWVLEDRKKHLLIKKQHPELDIRMVFQSSKTKIRKGSKTTYGMYCDKHDIPWAEKTIPESWLNEKKSLSKG